MSNSLKHSSLTHSLQIHCTGSIGPRSHSLLGLVQKSRSHSWRRLWELLVWLYYTGRIAKWCTILGASDIMCMPHTLVRGQILANLVVGSTGPPLEERAATQSDSRGLRGETSSGRYILISFDLLKRLNGALARTGHRTSYFRGIITHCQLFKC